MILQSLTLDTDQDVVGLKGESAGLGGSLAPKPSKTSLMILQWLSLLLWLTFPMYFEWFSKKDSFVFGLFPMVLLCMESQIVIKKAKDHWDENFSEW